mgnify:CR=1 FL=1|tara:strand:- start:858 stop:1727 length:870 start_codon:yes stop_codon:yes gene_type:complete
MTKLSKEYESTIQYPVEYTNLPNDKLLQEEPVSRIGIHVKASGFKIISGKLFPNKIKIESSSPQFKSKTNYFLLLSQQRLAIQRQMNAEVDIDHFIKDSIRFNLGLLERKRVPVKINSNVSYGIGYDIKGEIEVKPDSITISGPESILDTIQFVETTELVKKELIESIQEVALLKKFPQTMNVNYDVEQVNVSAVIEKYTEGTLKIPFSIINLPDGMIINTYPKEIDITYKVSLSDFGKINPSSFVVECDYEMSLHNKLQYLVPKLTQQSNLIKNAKISPSRIDFVIEK